MIASLLGRPGDELATGTPSSVDGAVGGGGHEPAGGAGIDVARATGVADGALGAVTAGGDVTVPGTGGIPGRGEPSGPGEPAGAAGMTGRAGMTGTGGITGTDHPVEVVTVVGFHIAIDQSLVRERSGDAGVEKRADTTGLVALRAIRVQIGPHPVG